MTDTTASTPNLFYKWSCELVTIDSRLQHRTSHIISGSIYTTGKILQSAAVHVLFPNEAGLLCTTNAAGAVFLLLCHGSSSSRISHVSTQVMFGRRLYILHGTIPRVHFTKSLRLRASSRNCAAICCSPRASQRLTSDRNARVWSDCSGSRASFIKRRAVVKSPARAAAAIIAEYPGLRGATPLSNTSSHSCTAPAQSPAASWAAIALATCHGRTARSAWC